jgi:hypothetical protein
MLLFPLALIDSLDIVSSKRFHTDANHAFGFVEGATAKITFPNPLGAFIVGLIPSSVLSEFSSMHADAASYCSYNDTVSDLQILQNDSDFTFSATIPSRQSYVPFFLSCDCESYVLHVSYFFYNVDSHLDYHWELARVSYPIFIAIHFLLNFLIHFLITVTFIFITMCTSLSFASSETADSYSFVPVPLRDPESIPIYSKVQCVAVYYRLLTGYSLALVTAIVFEMFLATLIWVTPFIYGVMDLLVCAALGWLIRLEPGMIGTLLILDIEIATTIAPAECSVEADDPADDEEQAVEGAGNAESPRVPPVPGSEAAVLHEAALPENPYDSTDL